MPTAHSRGQISARSTGAYQAAVDRQTGDVFYIYGNRDPVTGNNRLAVRRLSDDKHGGLAIGPEVFVTGQVQAAIPAVAITTRPFAAIPWSVQTLPRIYFAAQRRNAFPYPRHQLTRFGRQGRILGLHSHDERRCCRSLPAGWRWNQLRRVVRRGSRDLASWQKPAVHASY